MVPISSDERSDAEVASALADGAGSLLLALRETGLFTGRALADAGDGVAQEFLAHALKAHRPDDAVLSEEAADDKVRLTSRRTWIIDPLDGTREYSEGRDDWAVHIALYADRVLSASAVALPARHQVFAMDALPHPGAGAAALTMAVSRSRAPELVSQVALDLGAALVPMGSAGVKAMAVVAGEVAIYLHAGGQYEWDSAAPVGVARAAGLHTSRIDGSELIYNQADPYLPDLLICRPELAESVLAAVARTTSQRKPEFTS